MKILFSNMKLLVSLMRATFSRVVVSKCLIEIMRENNGKEKFVDRRYRQLLRNVLRGGRKMLKSYV